MYSTKLSIAIHILSVVALAGEKPVTSLRIAESINTNPALVRRLMLNLKKAELITTSTKLGVTGLAKNSEKITLLEVFRAVENRAEMFGVHTRSNPKCPVGARIEGALRQTYSLIQTAAEEKLSSVTLADITKALEA